MRAAEKARCGAGVWGMKGACLARIEFLIDGRQLLVGVLHCFGRGDVRFLHTGAWCAPFGSVDSRQPGLDAKRFVVLTFHSRNTRKKCAKTCPVVTFLTQCLCCAAVGLSVTALSAWSHRLLERVHEPFFS